MERFATLLLEVWRESCRHMTFSDALEQIVPLLARRLPVDTVVVRRLDPAHATVETWIVEVGAGAAPPRVVQQPWKEELLREFTSWCRQNSVVRGDMERLEIECPGIVPDGQTGNALIATLPADDATGVMLLIARPPRAFLPEHETMAEALREPFSRALQNDRQIRELTQLREAAEAEREFLLSKLGRQDISDAIVGAESGLKSVMERVDLVSPLHVPVLLLGETGSGKEVVARAIHDRSTRKAGPFLRVNCGAIPSELIDSELFGHERGSFTGAVAPRKGWFERADGGTLFLDEVGELSLAAQVRLLRILQDGTFERVGGQRSMHVDVRVVAATHRDLRSMIGENLFRKDLWYRIAVFVISIPPLRDRQEDILPLATHYALRAAKRLGIPPLIPRGADSELLVHYPWPGNVRELSSVIERAVILGNGRSLEIAKALGSDAHPLPMHHEPDTLPALPAEPAGDHRHPASTLDDAMRRHIEEALRKTGGRVEGPFGAALALGINPNTLRARMRKLGISRRSFRMTPPAK